MGQKKRGSAGHVRRDTPTSQIILIANFRRIWPKLFPTYQVRVVRFYHNCSSSSSAASSSFLLASFLANLLRQSCVASSGSQSTPLDLNRKDPIAVRTPGPQPQRSDRNVQRWTSTARIRSQCAPLDPNRKDPIAMCTARPQPQGSDRNVHTARPQPNLNQIVCQIKSTNTKPQLHNHNYTTTTTQPQTHNH